MRCLTKTYVAGGSEAPCEDRQTRVSPMATPLQVDGDLYPAMFGKEKAQQLRAEAGVVATCQVQHSQQ